MVKSKEGWNTEKIHTWLEEEHQICLSLSSLYSFLKRKKQENQAQAQQIFAEATAKSADKQVSIMNEIIETFYQEVAKSMKDGKKFEAARLAEVLFKFQSKLIDMSGINCSALQEQDHEEIRDSLLKKAGLEIEAIKSTKDNTSN